MWVAAGTYKNNPKETEPACFIIKEGVDVYGAFPATGTPGKDERKPLDDTDTYMTVLEPQSVKALTDKLVDADYVNYRTENGVGLNGIHSENSNFYIRRVLAQENKYNPKRFEIADTETEVEYYWRKGFNAPKK